MPLLGIDVGTTACKAIAFSTDGQQLSYSYIEYPKSENVYETNGNMIWENVSSVIKTCALESKEKITAVSISSFGEAFVPVDQNGNVLMNTMLYTDPRGKKETEELIKSLGNETIMGITGVNPNPMYSLPKMMYIKENHPDTYRDTYKFLLIGSFCTYKLTGKAVIDYSLAARTMAFDVLHKTWSKELLAAAGIEVEKLATPLPSGTVAGELLPELAEKLSLPKGTLVVTGGHDQICAALGAGVTAAGTAIDGTGTVECITPVFDHPILTDNFLKNNYACVPYAMDGMYATYAFNFTGGAILKWYKDNFAKFEASVAKEKGVSVYKLLDDMGATEPTDLIIVPHFAGSATPDMNGAARGAILGLKFDTTSSQIYRAMIEGVTYEMVYNMEILAENGIHIEELRAVGGGAKSDYWLKIKADITGKTIVPLECDEAGIIGAAILAGVATGVFGSIAEAAELFVKKKTAILPDQAAHSLYKENYKRYKAVRKAAETIYQN